MRLYLAKLIERLIILLLLVCCLSLMGQWYFLFELLTHFRLWYWLVGVLLLFIGVMLNPAKRWWLWCALLLGLNLQPLPKLLPWPAPPVIDNGPRLKVLHSNINVANDDLDSLAQHIRQHRPGLISLQEVNEVNAQWMQREFPDYQWLCATSSTPFGLCVASKYPFQQSSIETLQDKRVSSAFVRLQIQQREINLAFIHPPPPISSELFNSRNREYLALIARVRDYPNLVVVGDLNTTQWSPWYRKLVGALELKNHAPVWQGTWPNVLSLPILQIDHVLSASNIAVVSHQVLPSVNSDHRPILSEFLVR